ncbi:hypothetical protein RRG08_059822 [Elysia crispata]|uniref:Uncharacterized protein n=1 Tax=Elysia crispata TaxID=231223 RepID=A0AAE1BDH7_9GAST|nr:hypothetical protein RRG08_059822 [Elysia crispata]
MKPQNTRWHCRIVQPNTLAPVNGVKGGYQGREVYQGRTSTSEPGEAGGRRGEPGKCGVRREISSGQTSVRFMCDLYEDKLLSGLYMNLHWAGLKMGSDDWVIAISFLEDQYRCSLNVACNIRYSQLLARLSVSVCACVCCCLTLESCRQVSPVYANLAVAMSGSNLSYRSDHGEEVNWTRLDP